jgi:hypothetical protein
MIYIYIYIYILLRTPKGNFLFESYFLEKDSVDFTYTTHLIHALTGLIFRAFSWQMNHVRQSSYCVDCVKIRDHESEILHNPYFREGECFSSVNLHLFCQIKKNFLVTIV